MIENQTNKIVVVGAGERGSPILSTLLEKKHLVDVVGVVDKEPQAKGLRIASEHGVQTHNCIYQAMQAHGQSVYFNLTGNPELDDIIAQEISPGSVIGGTEAALIMSIIYDLRSHRNKLLHEASHDSLTDAYNRRYVMESLKNGLHRAKRYQQNYAVALIDLDHFKAVNDTYGHAAGDHVLIETVRFLSSHARASDIVGRWGGEEFIILMPETSAIGATAALQKWLLEYTALKMDVGIEKRSFSFSCGIEEFDFTTGLDDIESVMTTLINEADRKLYIAKEQGRSRVVGL